MLELWRIDAASGQRTGLAVLRPGGRTVNDVHALPGGGMVLSVRDSTMSGIHRFMVPGLPDTVFALPPIQTSAGVLATSPDGREVAAFGQDGRQFYVEGVDLHDLPTVQETTSIGRGEEGLDARGAARQDGEGARGRDGVHPVS